MPINSFPALMPAPTDININQNLEDAAEGPCNSNEFKGTEFLYIICHHMTTHYINYLDKNVLQVLLSYIRKMLQFQVLDLIYSLDGHFTLHI